MTAILFAKENWIVDRLAKEYMNYVPDTADCFSIFTNAAQNPPTYTLEDLRRDFSAQSGGDLWCISPWAVSYNDILRFPGSAAEVIWKTNRVIQTIHHIVPEKFLCDFKKNKIFEKLDQYTDLYHVTNEKTKQALKQYTEKDIEVLPLWSNPEQWYSIRETPLYSRLLESMPISKDKFTIGSFQRDTEGYDLVSPKLEKGPDILCDIVEKLQKTGKEGKKIELVLAGYNRQYVINRLSETVPDLNIAYFEKAPIENMNYLYNCLDLYVVSSRTEGGPQALVEASLARCPIVSTDVGIAKEILSPESIYSNAEDFELATPNVEVAYNNAMKLAPENGIIEKFKKMLSGT